MVSERIRAELTFSRDEIDSMERKPVPPGFFEPPPPPPRATEPEPTKPDEALYLEVPIDGVFGEQVFAAGIEKALRYARRYRIEHVVFRINSAGGDLHEAADEALEQASWLGEDIDLSFFDWENDLQNKD